MSVVAVVEPLWTPLAVNVAPETGVHYHSGILAELASNAVATAQLNADYAAQVLRESGLDATPVLIEGTARHAILEYAQEQEIDCIFLGALGRSRAERLFIGSVASTVASRATCSVEVVRPNMGR